MTPREFSALDRILENKKHTLDVQFAALQATLHNAFLRPEGHKGYSLSDFLPADEDPKESADQNVETQKSFLRMMLLAGAGNLPVVERPFSNE